MSAICTAEEAIKCIQNGEMIILVDDEDRENEGDLVIAGVHATAKHINFMATYGRGLICLALSPEIADYFGLSPMVCSNESRFGTNFTVSIEAREGITTGISAFDRAKTIATVLAEGALPSDIVSPGHIFPLRAKEGGVLARQGQTEGSVDLARFAGLKPAGVICEILNDDGTMARLPELEVFAKNHGLPIVSVKELMRYRIQHGLLSIEALAEADLPTQYGDFTIHAYSGAIAEQPTIAIVKGTCKGEVPIPIRIHSECLTGDIFGSCRCDCGEQLAYALSYIEKEGRGIIIYLRQEGRGIGLVNKLRAYTLQEQGLDTVEANEKLGFSADLREYSVAAQVLRGMGVQNVVLLSNNPKKRAGLEEFGITVVEEVAVETTHSIHNEAYLKTKRDKLGHTLHI